MPLPNFLGVGVEKCGTTWLHQLLSTHPFIYVPDKRREIHYFDWYYDRGTTWYEKFFPDEQEAKRFRAIGEITPSYLFCKECPQRISETESVSKIMVMIRNPVNRAYSHYWHRVRLDRYSGSFEEFLKACPEALNWGFYSQGLEHFLRFFSREHLLVLVSERALRDVDRTRVLLSEFLEVPVDLFPSESGRSTVNKGFMPRFHFLYSRSVRLAYFLRRNDLDWLINLVKKAGFTRLFSSETSLPPMDPAIRRQLEELYQPEISRLEQLLSIDLSHWQTRA